MPLLWQNQLKALGHEGLDFVSVSQMMIVYTDDTLMIINDTDERIRLSIKQIAMKNIQRAKRVGF